MISFGRSLLVIGVSMMATACGRKGPLLYPDMLVLAAPAAVAAQQSGPSVKLHFTLPDKDRAGRPLPDVAGVKISRKVAETGQGNVCRTCMADYVLYNTLYLDHLPPTAQRHGSRLVVIDSDVSAGNVYSYRIAPFTANGVDGASSPVADVRVAAEAVPGPLLEIEALPTEVKLHVTAHPLMSARMIGFNLYRSSGSAAVPRSYLPLNREPLKGNEYIDANLERGVAYRYSVRALIVLASGSVVESAESAVVEAMLKDDD